MPKQNLTRVKNPPFSTNHFQLHVIFNYIFNYRFFNITKIVMVESFPTKMVKNAIVVVLTRGHHFRLQFHFRLVLFDSRGQ
jgi:hypothetical protein